VAQLVHDPDDDGGERNGDEGAQDAADLSAGREGEQDDEQSRAGASHGVGQLPRTLSIVAAACPSAAASGASSPTGR
jgi:hypothetical protein